MSANPGSEPAPGLAELLARLRAPAAAATTEVGAVEGDLPIWRAREAIRHGELRLGAQAQAMQALEARATSMLGWCVTGGLALGAAAANGTHRRAALVAAFYLLSAALMCAWGMVRRDWTGPGYMPDILLRDVSSSEYVALVELAHGYQTVAAENSRNFNDFGRKLNRGIILMFLAPVAGFCALLSGGALPPLLACAVPLAVALVI